MKNEGEQIRQYTMQIIGDLLSWGKANKSYSQIQESQRDQDLHVHIIRTPLEHSKTDKAIFKE